MRQRLISAAVLVPVVVIVFLAGHPWLTIGVAIVAVLAAYEAAQLVRRSGLPVDMPLALVAPLLAILAFELVIGPGSLEFGWILIAPAFGVWIVATGVAALRVRDPRTGLLAWAGNAIATLYPSLLGFVVGILGFGFGSFAGDARPILGDLDAGRAWLLVLVLTVWTLDSAAYLAGRFHGRGRFMNHISPNKTWSGAIGGTLAAIVVCTALVVLAGLHPVAGVALGLLIAVSAQAGDLAESMLKRAAGAKDSGTLIPGHGGVLDRVDSFLFAAPVMYAALVLFQWMGLAWQGLA